MSGRWNAEIPPSVFDKGSPGRRAMTFPKWDGEAVEVELPDGARRAEAADLPALSEPQVGRFRTAPGDRRSVSFVWSGDTGSWGIDEARGGMRTYATMARSRPDFFIHSSDHIYADCPLHAERKLPNGEVWRNIVTEDKSKIAQTLAEFRGNYKYNLLDKNVLAFNAEVPLFAQWDDHEVTNDWCPGESLGWHGLTRKQSVWLRSAQDRPLRGARGVSDSPGPLSGLGPFRCLTRANESPKPNR